MGDPILRSMTKKKPGAKRYRYRPGGYQNKTIAMHPDTIRAMRHYPDINWSSVIESYVKVYLYDLSRGVPRHKGE